MQIRYYIIFILNSIVYRKKHIYSNITRDFLKRVYNCNESLLRIPKLSEYYKNYHLFFCSPTLRHMVLGKIVGNYKDRKAEIFYKNNYKESKDNNSNKKILKKKKIQTLL